ncbi:MAG: hypothetical protein MZV64_24075 [Ignavibacteriales bacterium]|nr:hypothetical protein [Ignavibacteriales bacterium]
MAGVASRMVQPAVFGAGEVGRVRVAEDASAQGDELTGTRCYYVFDRDPAAARGRRRESLVVIISLPQ